MAMRIVINSKEITNPFARAIIGVVALAVVILLLLLVLPLIGIAFAVSLGIFLGVFAAILLVVFIGILFAQPRKPKHVPLERPKDK
jgi:preprotein translocase subunit SecF